MAEMRTLKRSWEAVPIVCFTHRVLNRVQSAAVVMLVFVCSLEQVHAQIRAFPGAEGGGMYTKGGRGGKVFEVTSLADDGKAGTLRYAINQSGARTVIFRISGTIVLTSDLKITRDSITIAGQTAPGDGICLRKYALYVNANEVILRYLRVRLGDETGGESDAMSSFSNSGSYYKNIIVDHCSASWSTDETLSYYGNEYVTVQWCIISESLYNSSHPKGAHGYGGIWGGKDHASFHHNLLAHHSSRNPRLSGSGTTVACYNVDLRNNVIYNWGFNSAYGGEASTANFINNYYKPGPATKSGVKSRIYQPSDTLGVWHVSGNYVEGNPAVSSDNWAGGVNPSIAVSDLNKIKATAPFPSLPVTTQTPQQAFDLVLQYAGATLPRRDTVDARIVYETRNGKVTYGGRTYAKAQGFDTTKVYGIIDTQTDVGGWPTLNSLTPSVDADHDGMPDDWELSHALNPGDASDRNIISANGYTMLEKYLNELVGSDPSTTTAVSGNNRVPVQFALDQNYPNPFSAGGGSACGGNPTTAITYHVPAPIGLGQIEAPAKAGLPANSSVTLKVYDLLGREVATLVNEVRQPGVYTVQWDGSLFPSGVYFYSLKVGNSILTKRMLLIK